MTLYFFSATPFTSATQITPVDTFVGDGVTTTFNLQNKTIGLLGNNIQAGNTIYAQYKGDFTKNSSTQSFTLNTAPGLGTQIVAPGIGAVIAAAFDNQNINNTANPQQVQVPFWLCDPYTANQYTYTGFPQDPGIMIAIVNEISGFGASTAWCQLACSDRSGNALTFQATGTTLYTAPMNAFGQVSASSAAGASSIFCGTASGFVQGDYILFNPGGANSEVCHINTVNGSFYNFVLDGGGPNFTHAAGEYVFTCGRKFWLQVTIPTNLTNNTAANYYNLALRRKFVNALHT